VSNACPSIFPEDDFLRIVGLNLCKVNVVIQTSFRDNSSTVLPTNERASLDMDPLKGQRKLVFRNVEKYSSQ